MNRYIIFQENDTVSVKASRMYVEGPWLVFEDEFGLAHTAVSSRFTYRVLTLDSGDANE